MKKIALITGASSGIGLEFARLHASKGGDLVLIARRGDLLENLKCELKQKYASQVHMIVKDLSEPSSAKEIFSEIQAKNLQIDYLINNAGFGGHGFFYERSLEEETRMIQVNVASLVSLTRLVVEQMIQRRQGKILNVASVAGFIPGPQHAIYYATKAFVISFSEALAMEVLDTNVSVTVLCPGTTQTDFFKVAEMKPVNTSKWASFSPEYVASVGYQAMLKGQVMAIPGFVNRAFLFSLRFMPKTFIRKVSQWILSDD